MTEAKLKPTSKKTRHHGSVNKRTRKNWTSEQARLALDDIADGVPVKTAAKKWSIPRTTLRDNERFIIIHLAAGLAHPLC